MTCVEKLRELHPDWNDTKIEKYTYDFCPSDQYIAEAPLFCLKTMDCIKCWGRKIQDESDNLYKIEERLSGESMRRLERLRDRLGKNPNEIIMAALLNYEEEIEIDTYGIPYTGVTSSATDA